MSIETNSSNLDATLVQDPGNDSNKRTESENENLSKSKQVPTSKLKRSAITGLAAARVGAKHLSYKTRSLLTREEDKEASRQAYEEQIGELIFSVLTQLRGTALKVSQILSMEADILPLSIRDKLKEACYQVPPINRALVRKQLVQEFGKAPNELFRQFNSHAFAAASIGQVHQGITFSGDAVAIKVQYPGIASTIESDLKIIETLFSAISRTSDFLPQKQVLNVMMSEMQDRLREEVNYHVEAKNIKWFKDRVKLPNIVIPDVIEDYSSKRVLTLEMLEGYHLREWLETNPTQLERNQLGQQLFDYFWYCVFHLRKINADAHPGNFLVLNNGNLAALDFGCVRELSDDFTNNFVNLIPALVAVFHSDRVDGNNDGLTNSTKSIEQLHKAYSSLKVISSEVSAEQFQQELLPSIEPFGRWLCEAYVLEEFDFSNKQPCPGKPDEHSKALVKHLDGLFQEQLCFDRAHLGLMNLLTEMKAVIKTDWNKYYFAECDE